MAVPSSGTISIQDLVDEFGGSTPHAMSEYYRGGSEVPNVPANSGIPTSGTLALSDFYGAVDAVFIAATGGTITTSGDFKIHTFTSSGTFEVTTLGNSAGSNTVEYLVVAGGGGGTGGKERHHCPDGYPDLAGVQRHVHSGGGIWSADVPDRFCPGHVWPEYHSHFDLTKQTLTGVLRHAVPERHYPATGVSAGG